MTILIVVYSMTVNQYHSVLRTEQRLTQQISVTQLVISQVKLYA